jgi:hypothetical protein
MNNPIIEEVRAARAALAKEHGYDLHRIHEWARAAHEERARMQRHERAQRDDAGSLGKEGKAEEVAKP